MCASKSVVNGLIHHHDQQQSNNLGSSHLMISCPVSAVISCLPAGHDARHSHPCSYSKGQLRSALVSHLTPHCLVLHISCHMTLHMLAQLTAPILMLQFVMHSVILTAVAGLLLSGTTVLTLLCTAPKLQYHLNHITCHPRSSCSHEGSEAV